VVVIHLLYHIILVFKIGSPSLFNYHLVLCINFLQMFDYKKVLEIQYLSCIAFRCRCVDIHSMG
jgi:hypothetical protein